VMAVDFENAAKARANVVLPFVNIAIPADT
jgi:hypothetical protein